MFRLPRNTEMTLELLAYFVNKHKENVKNRYKKLKDAYESDHDILHQRAKEEYKPDNRIVVNFPKYIVDTMNGFILGNPVKTITNDEKVSQFVEYIEKYNNIDDNNAELSKISSIYGKAYEMYYTDENAELCITYLDPLEAFMIYDESIIERPLFFVRYYTDFDNVERGSISDGSYIRNFKITGGYKWVDEWEPHNFGDVPATEYVENEERQGLFEPVLTQVNAYNKAISEKANDVDYFSDAYMKVIGPKVEKEDTRFIRETRIVNFENNMSDEKPEVDFMEKPSNDATQENLLNRLEKQIFAISMVANISDENFGNASGISLKYKLQSMTNLAKVKQRKFEKGMNRRYKLLFGHPASKVPADSWIGLSYHFTPNIPANLQEESEIARNLEGITSHETQLKVISAVGNIKEELNRIEEENKTTVNEIPDDFMFKNQDKGTE